MRPDFQTILESSPNSYMLLDRQLRYLWANAAYLRVTGSRLEDLVGRHILDVFPNDPRDPANPSARLLTDSLARVLETRTVDVIAFVPYRVPARREDGSPGEERYWSATHTPILDEQGEVASLLQHTVDVTELYRLKHGAGGTVERPGVVEAGVLQRAQYMQEVNLSLDAERSHLRRLFEQSPGFMCSLRGRDHVFELANSAYKTLVGSRDLIGQPLARALPEVEEQGFVDLLDRVYRTGEPYVGRGVRALLKRDPGGPPEEVLLDFVYQPVVDANGRVTGIFVQGHDITEQRRLQAELEELLARERQVRADAEEARADAERANRLKDEFLATLSHELRTPLNALLGWARLLRSGSLAADMRTHAIEVIERNARLQAQMVDDILDVSRIASGKLHLRVRPIDFGRVVAAALEIVSPAAEAKGVAIRHAEPPAIPMNGDPERLQQVVWNLLSNAIKFTPPGGTVDVQVARAAGAVRLTVVDTGIGIPQGFLAHVFERFRQAEGGAERAHGGLGLGLAVVKHVVEAHGGLVHAQSDGENRGATFMVSLPVAAFDQDAAPEVHPAADRVRS